MTSTTISEFVFQFQNYLEDKIQYLMPFYYSVSAWFCQWTEDINFGYFSIIYSIIFLTLAWRFNRKTNFRPKNRQLKSFKEAFKDKLFNIIFEFPFIKSQVYGKFHSELNKQEKEFVQLLSKQWDEKRANCLPYEGMSEENLKKRINEWKNVEKHKRQTGKISGSFYTTDEEHYKAINDFAGTYMYQNPLHFTAFKQLLKMESQILKMTSSLLTSTNQEYYGTITSGGSESLILAIYAYKKYYSSRTKPNIVIPVTAHAAVDKGCFYFNVQIRKARLNKNFEVDVNHLQSMIDGNTIMIFGSAPNYPHGIVDPIDKLAKIAKKYDVGMHVDGCLGGFVGTFHKEYKHLYSLDRDGVTSVSLDHHKFALAPKGLSAIIYKTKQLRHCQYFHTLEWTGGIYGTGTIQGSRSGFASAGGWYALTQIGKKQYERNAVEIIKATKESARKLRQIEGIQVFGNPQLCVISFTTTQCSHLHLADYLNKEKDWKIAPIHKPNGIHISLTLANYENVAEKLPDDIREGLKFLKDSKPEKESATTVLYGSTTKIPTGFLQNEVLKCCIRASLK